MCHPAQSEVVGVQVIEPLTWEATYALAEALMQRHAGVDLAAVSLSDIHRWVLALSGFDDDPALANDDVLLAIYREWLELTLEAQG